MPDTTRSSLCHPSGPIASGLSPSPTSPTRTTAAPMGPPPKPAQRKVPILRGGVGTSDYSMDESTASDRFQDRDHSPSSHSFSASELGEDDGWHSDWSNYGDVPDVLDEYDRAVELIDGSDSWNWEQRQVHQLIYMRGIHPMIPSWWRMSYKMWGVDQPQLDHVFTPPDSKKRVVISAWRNEVAGAKALEKLFYLSQTVNDYEKLGFQDKMESTIVKAIENYHKWSVRDARVNKYALKVVLVEAYPPNKTDTDHMVLDVDEQSSDYIEDESEIEEALAVGGADADDETDKEATRRFIRFVNQDLNRKMKSLGEEWRNLLRARGSGPASNESRAAFVTQPPTLYGFAVVQHMLIIASHDASRMKNPVIVLHQMSLGDRGLWLWNALSIAIPINVAKATARKLARYTESEQFASSQEEDDEDPDL